MLLLCRSNKSTSLRHQNLVENIHSQKTSVGTTAKSISPLQSIGGKKMMVEVETNKTFVTWLSQNVDFVLLDGIQAVVSSCWDFSLHFAGILIELTPFGSFSIFLFLPATNLRKSSVGLKTPSIYHRPSSKWAKLESPMNFISASFHHHRFSSSIRCKVQRTWQREASKLKVNCSLLKVILKFLLKADAPIGH